MLTMRHVLVCGVSNLLNSFMPTLPWWFLVLALTGLTTWAVTTKARLYAAKRHRVEAGTRAWREIRDVLATVIADPAVTGEAREKALKAYDSVSRFLGKENSTT